MAWLESLMRERLGGWLASLSGLSLGYGVCRRHVWSDFAPYMLWLGHGSLWVVVVGFWCVLLFDSAVQILNPIFYPRLFGLNSGTLFYQEKGVVFQAFGDRFGGTK